MSTRANIKPVYRLKTPKTNFQDWLDEHNEQEFFQDMAHIGGIMYTAMRKKSKVSRERKYELLKIFQKKWALRLFDFGRPHIPAMWDQRSWKWYWKINDELKAFSKKEMGSRK